MKTNLTAKEICDIIAQCGNSHISTFQYGNLKLNFTPQKQKIVGPEATLELPNNEAPEEPQAQIPALTKEEQELAELDELKFTNPVLFEEQLRKLSNGRA